jgi:hypothetical protein
VQGASDSHRRRDRVFSPHGQSIASHLSSFEKALEELGVDDVLPGVENVADGVEIYQRVVSLETQRKDGVCMIELSVAPILLPTDIKVFVTILVLFLAWLF